MPTTQTYVTGSDVIEQAQTYDAPECLLYDGHGSTRQILANDGSTIDDSYSYDAYGMMLGGNPTSAPATNHLYAGESFDISSQMYYNRARWYDTSTGRFNRTDPYSGNPHDPQSLHKYLYCHANPVNNTDPSGLFSLSEINISMSIAGMLYRNEKIRFWQSCVAELKGCLVHVI